MLGLTRASVWYGLSHDALADDDDASVGVTLVTFNDTDRIWMSLEITLKLSKRHGVDYLISEVNGCCVLRS